MATIQDVAKHAHVGVGTVSRVLSGNGYVKQETREKIEKSIAELNYTPNQMARNLFFHKSGIVAVIVPDAGHPFFAQLVNAMEAALCEKGYQTMICNTYREKNYELRYLDMLKQQRVDGIIFGSHTTQDISRYRNIQRPIVALDRKLGDEIPCVMSDHKSGGRLAAEEMIRAGCKKVVQVGDIEARDQVFTPSQVRYKIFSDIMEAHGITCLNWNERWSTSSIAYYQKTANAILDRYPDADGIFATDIVIMALMQAALSRGKGVPEQLKLVAYDGTPLLGLTYPRVTAVVQPVAQLAKKAVQLVVDLIEEKPIKDKWIELPVTLYLGDTTVQR